MHKFDHLTIFVFQAAVHTAFDTTSRVVYDKRLGWPKIISKNIYLSELLNSVSFFFTWIVNETTGDYLDPKKGVVYIQVGWQSYGVDIVWEYKEQYQVEPNVQ